jgi:hypothetical protein
MIRRRSQRDSQFGLDSFLDLVTNVVGIIIRLIIVAWVGARAYHSLPDFAKQAQPTPADNRELPGLHDPLEDELERQRQELADAESRLLEQLRELGLLQEEQRRTEERLTGLALDRQQLRQRQQELEQARRLREKKAGDVKDSLAELAQRRQQLNDELHYLEKTPKPSKVLHYHVPVSETVHAAESHFECRHGRAALVELDTMLDQVRRGLRDKEQVLQSQWEVSDVTEPVGAFRLRYVIERRRSNLDAAFNPAAPAQFTSFSYGISEWQVEPIDPRRGEPADAALAAGSAFRRVIDGISVEKAAVTFWVYRDSWELYRRLRDHAAARGLTVAGRPLPDDALISGSPWGRKSRGQ